MPLDTEIMKILRFDSGNVCGLQIPEGYLQPMNLSLYNVPISYSNKDFCVFRDAFGDKVERSVR